MSLNLNAAAASWLALDRKRQAWYAEAVLNIQVAARPKSRSIEPCPYCPADFSAETLIRHIQLAHPERIGVA